MAATRIEGYIQDKKTLDWLAVDLLADLSESGSLEVVYALSDFEDLDKPTSFYSQEVVLVGTHRTQKALNHIERIDVSNTTSSNLDRAYNFRLIVDGVDALKGEGKWLLTDITYDGNLKCFLYNGSTLGSRFNWIVPLVDKDLCSLDLGTVIKNDENVYTSWGRAGITQFEGLNNSTGLPNGVFDNIVNGGTYDDVKAVWLPANYGEFPTGLGLGAPDAVHFDDLSPWTYIRYLVDKMVEQCTDYTLVSNFFRGEEFSGLLYSFYGKDLATLFSTLTPAELQSLGVKANSQTVPFNYNPTPTSHVLTNFLAGEFSAGGYDNGTDYDPEGNWSANVYTCYRASERTVTGRLVFRADVALNTNIFDNVVIALRRITGTPTGASYTHTELGEPILAGQEYFLDFTLPSFCCTIGDSFSVTIQFPSGVVPLPAMTLLDTGFLLISAANNPSCVVNELPLAQAIACGKTCKELLDDLTLMYHLEWDSDPTKKEIYVEPAKDFRNPTRLLCMKELIDCASEITQDLTVDNGAGIYKFRYTEDGEDEYAKTYAEQFDRESMWEGEITVPAGDGVPTTDEKKYETEILSPARSEQDINTAFNPGGSAPGTHWPHWVKLWNEYITPTTNAKLPVFYEWENPRVVYFGGALAYPDDGGLGTRGFRYVDSTGASRNFPFFPHAWQINEIEPERYSLGWGSNLLIAQDNPDIGLIDRFWSDYFTNLKASRIVTLNTIFTPKHFEQINLRDLVLIDHNLIGRGIARFLEITWDVARNRAQIKLLIEAQK